MGPRLVFLLLIALTPWMLVAGVAAALRGEMMMLLIFSMMTAISVSVVVTIHEQYIKKGGKNERRP